MVMTIGAGVGRGRRRASLAQCKRNGVKERRKWRKRKGDESRPTERRSGYVIPGVAVRSPKFMQIWESPGMSAAYVLIRRKGGEV